MFEKINESPQSGMVYALLRSEYIFEPYSENVIEKIKMKSEELIELHIFDDNKEYRIVNSNRGCIEVVVDDNYPCDDRYVEKVYISKKGPDQSDGFDKENDRITVINYLGYDELGMVKVVNYRYSTDLSL